jgi:hypothetical protein
MWGMLKTRPKSLLRHHREEHDLHSAKCPLKDCPKLFKFETAAQFDKHFVLKHIEELNFEDDKESDLKLQKILYACPFCDQRFLTMGPDFRWHLRRHSFNILPDFHERPEDYLEGGSRKIKKIQIIGEIRYKDKSKDEVNFVI